MSITIDKFNLLCINKFEYIFKTEYVDGTLEVSDCWQQNKDSIVSGVTELSATWLPPNCLLDLVDINDRDDRNNTMLLQVPNFGNVWNIIHNRLRYSDYINRHYLGKSILNDDGCITLSQNNERIFRIDQRINNDNTNHDTYIEFPNDVIICRKWLNKLIEVTCNDNETTLTIDNIVNKFVNIALEQFEPRYQNRNHRPIQNMLAISNNLLQCVKMQSVMNYTFTSDVKELLTLDYKHITTKEFAEPFYRKFGEHMLLHLVHKLVNFTCSPTFKMPQVTVDESLLLKDRRGLKLRYNNVDNFTNDTETLISLVKQFGMLMEIHEL